MSDFFQPPPAPSPAQVPWPNPPPWTGRPQGTPPGVVITELLLARSELAEVSIAYVDAYPEGFEFEVEASAVAVERVCRDSADTDIFGRHWPMLGDRKDEIPPQLLRIGVQFADGRKATNVTGRDTPVDGPIMSPLRGGGRGVSRGGSAIGEWSFNQGYWVSQLPPPGPLALVCEWPSAGIPLARHEVEAQLLLDAADRARAIFPVEGRVLKDDREWRLGTDAEVTWINDGTAQGRDITAAIPPSFAAYCTLVLPENRETELPRHERAVMAVLSERTKEQSWWLGYLDTGASGIDLIFPYAPRTIVYYGYGYVLVEAGPPQAAAWRDAGWNWALPDLIFPADRSWLVSTMWDDPWTCIGGPEELVSSILCHSELGPRARRVALGEDAIPPGHSAR